MLALRLRKVRYSSCLDKDGWEANQNMTAHLGAQWLSSYLLLSLLIAWVNHGFAFVIADPAACDP